MVGHKICSYGETLLIISKLSLLPLLIWNTVNFMLARQTVKVWNIESDTAWAKLYMSLPIFDWRKNILNESENMICLQIFF